MLIEKSEENDHARSYDTLEVQERALKTYQYIFDGKCVLRTLGNPGINFTIGKAGTR